MQYFTKTTIDKETYKIQQKHPWIRQRLSHGSSCQQAPSLAQCSSLQGYLHCSGEAKGTVTAIYQMYFEHYFL